jgi:transcription initiation factor TFIID subunit 7
MMNDINTKAVARQVLVDEVDRAKAGPGDAPPSGEGTPAGAIQYSDEDDDLFGEDGDDAGDVDIPPASGPETPRTLDAEGEDDTASVAGTPGVEVSTPMSEREDEEEEQDAEGEEEDDEEEGEGDEDDEMAAMLAAELGGGEASEAQDQTDAIDAIDSMEFQDDLENLGEDLILGSQPGVAGGVGQRRLLEGAEHDDDSSDDSDD